MDWQEYRKRAEETTFSKADLKPDEIDHTVNKVLTKDQGSDSFTVNVNAGGSYSAGLFGSVSANASYNQTGAKTWLKENGIDAEFTGKKWEIKSIDVVLKNSVSFNSEKTFQIGSVVTTEEPVVFKQSIDLSFAIQNEGVAWNDQSDPWDQFKFPNFPDALKSFDFNLKKESKRNMLLWKRSVPKSTTPKP